MTALAWQTLLILGLSYLAGCILGCFGRRMLAAEPARPVPAVRIPPAAKEAAAIAVPRVAPGKEFRRADADRPPVAPASARNAERFERALSGSAPALSPQPIPVPQPAPAARIAPLAPVVPQPIAAPHAAPAPAAERADEDLTLIRTIDKPLEAELRRAGIRYVSQIAAWSSADVKRFSQMLGFRGRISQENWIEQAQILARGGLTSYAQRKLRGEVASARPVRDEGDPRRSVIAAVTANRVAPLAPLAPLTPAAARGTAQRPAAATVATPDVAARAAFGGQGTAPRNGQPGATTERARDALQRIGGVSAEIETSLNSHGVTRYSQIGSWTIADMERYEHLLGCPGRIARENWVEQAQILARHGDTAYSREHDRRAAAPPLPPLKPATLAATAASEAVAGTDRRAAELAGLRSVRSEALRGEPAEPAALRSSRSGEPDDLKRIRGVGVLIEKKLHALGITSYQQIANWSADDIAVISEKLDFKGRIERENWIEQARILSSGGQTEFSRRVDRGALDY